MLRVVLYGKATGNGPWHIMPTRADGQSLCDKRARFHGTVIPPYARVCSRCRARSRES